MPPHALAQPQRGELRGCRFPAAAGVASGPRHARTGRAQRLLAAAGSSKTVLPSPDVFRALMCLVPLNLPYKRMVRWVLKYWQSAGSQDLNQLKFVVPEGVY